MMTSYDEDQTTTTRLYSFTQGQEIEEWTPLIDGNPLEPEAIDFTLQDLYIQGTPMSYDVGSYMAQIDSWTQTQAQFSDCHSPLDQPSA